MSLDFIGINLHSRAVVADNPEDKNRGAQRIEGLRVWCSG
jgi:hypothetical protein